MFGHAMKRFLLAWAVVFWLGAHAFAGGPQQAAVAPSQNYDWTGLYLGIDAGVGWAGQSASDVACASCEALPVSDTLRGSSAVGGLYGGYNLTFARSWLVGVEGDWSWTHLDDTASTPNLSAQICCVGQPIANQPVTWRDVNWLASLRGRLGLIPTPAILLYATGGAAWTKVSYSALDLFTNGCPNCGAVSFGQSKSGYVVGGGVEYTPWADNWLLKAEYLYYHFDGASQSSNFPGTTNFCCTFGWGNLSIQEFRVGVAYKFR